ncbi:hypothetical protein [Bacillus gaemokensis]|uniref:Transposase n=1 Tax=Bacillus gaemokensis TaxID=574375 RepID=A0A073KDV6_9BACI|nr:hypothetical protein [Bacillus gaemokensis]KEK24775.1 hypothetical protein BAGA_24310 [Bacillus gaemokensis]KYG34600.1 hypothetical protein AZF08_09410 [Bacillus gaemokensis]
MKEMKLQAVIRKKKRNYAYAKSNVIVPNILKRNFSTAQPNQKWVTDITHLIWDGKTIFLSVIYDLFNNEVVSYN